ncbi:MAG: hypothetical protein A3I89_04485 [Candidatus Harrisonbacteria bacterium RIFCSPLOWO2_02_FULL_41_11]|uniref:DUF5666 domain-containing protein n=1 Tax=Candidatus Harrisonbacteria bacterium RIFCSPHIGHO2_02_FULL_42_16 TaxID=1798404 RepID=A0A1G1ZFY4_9BACT|nr:MAG: hypothetical protein A3B92_01485 [Candidatus Harrisonbacteria bacterium RIFCSPHIGHO2_02_FULL_42_16]OGY66430.1 MAG: hypothetical protein A3I89_04485 [Candidatus Harrisonbacteria bacterium RIFCSPLOWO2_02_FULL_41_11]
MEGRNKKIAVAALLGILALTAVYFAHNAYLNNKAAKALEELGIRNIVGEVLSVKNNTLEVTADVPARANFSDNKPAPTNKKDYKVAVSGDTSIILLYSNGDKIMERKMAFNEIKPGDKITVIAAQNVLETEELTADSLIISR